MSQLHHEDPRLPTASSLGIPQVPAEHDWVETPGVSDGVVAAGNFVLARDDSGPLGTHYVWDSQGTLRSSADWRAPSSTYEFDPVRQRVYFFNDYFLGELTYESIDPSTGMLSDDRGTYSFDQRAPAPPIRVSPDGQLVLLGNGEVFDVDTLRWSPRVAPFKDAAWLASGGLAVLRASDTGTTLELRDPANTPVTSLPFAGAPLRVLASGSKLVIVTANGPTLRAYNY